jgi:hypothetical protein
MYFSQGNNNLDQSGRKRKDMCLWMPVGLQTSYGMQLLGHPDIEKWPPGSQPTGYHYDMARFLVHEPYPYGIFFSLIGKGQNVPSPY